MAPNRLIDRHITKIGHPKTRTDFHVLAVYQWVICHGAEKKGEVKKLALVQVGPTKGRGCSDG